MMLTETMTFILIWVGVLAFGMALFIPTLATLASRRSETEVGTALGLQSAANSLGQFAGPVTGGFYSFGQSTYRIYLLLSLCWLPQFFWGQKFFWKEGDRMVRILTEESLNLKIVWRKEGAQQAIFPHNDPGQLPITPLRQANGEWLRIQLDLPGHPISLRAWQIQVGRVKLYLLDSNDAANFPPYRGITSELHGGGPDLRLVQELVLGIGGWRLHGKVRRHIFAPLFPRWPQDEIPVGHVTNGVHMPTWDSTPADDLWTEACGKDRWLGTTETLEQDICRVSDAKLWQLRTAASGSFIEYVRERLSRQLAASGASPDDVDGAKHLFDPNALTLGFARRFATYKRPSLLLHDPERLLRLLTNPQRPVQLIIAGKAHPADSAGQALIQEWTHFIRRLEARPQVIFLSDYDMHLTEHLVQGVDVWINTPRRPWEASGTSGMKVLVNGGINLSELDGG
ncbi:MAG: alpha-glucan family phosphorylase [Desulfobacterales bacterium]